MLNSPSFNDKLKQVILLSVIILLGIVLLGNLWIFFPGILGAVTLFILGKEPYYNLVVNKKWNKSLTAILFILVFLIIVAIPIYISIELVSPKINAIVNNQDVVISSLKTFSDTIKARTGFEILSTENMQEISRRLSIIIPKLVNSTLSVVINLVIMFFLLYYMLVNGKVMEGYLLKLIPLRKTNVDLLAKETKVLIRANALGIPIICIVQGLAATLGYWIFGIEDWGLWGFLTGVFAYFPLVGTMIVWIPLVIYQFSTGASMAALGLTLYSIIVTGNIDYITRLVLMKKMGDIHPITTVLGVIVGLGLFGFMGLVFGPLLISYFLILVKIYINEFKEDKVDS